MKFNWQILPGAFVLGAVGLFSSTAAVASDSVGPTISSIKFLTTKVDPRTAPGAFQVKFSYADLGDDGTAASSSGVSYANFTMTSATTGQSFDYGYYFNSVAGPDGTITVEMSPLSLYAAPGEWSLVRVYIIDKNNNSTFYISGSDTEIPLSGSLPVVKNTVTPDTTVPTISSASITSKNISLASASPQVELKLQVQDDLSGVTRVGITATANKSSVSSTFYLSAPVVSGNAQVALQMTFASPGTWTITDLAPCDRPGNCRHYTGSELSAILPKATFKVVN